MSKQNQTKPIGDLIQELISWTKSLKETFKWFLMFLTIIYFILLGVIWYSIASIGDKIWPAIASLIVTGIILYTPFLILKIFTQIKPIKNQINNPSGNNSTVTRQVNIQRSWYEKEPFSGIIKVFGTVLTIIAVIYIIKGTTNGIGPELREVFTGKTVEQVNQESINKQKQKDSINNAKAALKKYELEMKEETKRLKDSMSHERQMSRQSNLINTNPNRNRSNQPQYGSQLEKDFAEGNYIIPTESDLLNNRPYQNKPQFVEDPSDLSNLIVPY